jgi:Fur family transcriptional regulator, peroxide stress response regulator
MPLTPADVEKRTGRFVEQCRELGIRLTHQRLEIYRELAKTEEHPAAEAIYNRVRKRMPTVSLDTIYRTLNLLEQKGVISKVGAYGDRTRFDATIDPHQHFVCTKCGLIQDLYCREFDGLETPRTVASVGEVQSIHVELRGVCSSCRLRRKRGR